MKVFIFEGVSQLSQHYHESGGLVVIADDKEAAKKLIEEENQKGVDDWFNDADIQLRDREWDDVIILELEDDVEPRVIIFPNAGCC